LIKASEFRELSDQELTVKERELREELFNLKFQRSTGQVENPTRVNLLRRDVARAQTVARERARAAEGET
jgi:large subunit ribosomal protein L29